MPSFPTFPIYLNDARESRVTSVTYQQALSVGTDLLKKLSTFTLRVFKDVFNKTYEEDASKLSYWLAPTIPVSRPSSET